MSLEGYGVIYVAAPFALYLCLVIIYNTYKKLWEQLSYSIKVNNIDCVCVSYLNLCNVK